MSPFKNARRLLLICGFAQDKKELNDDLTKTFGGDTLVRSAVCRIAGIITNHNIDPDTVSAEEYNNLLTKVLSWCLLPGHSSDGQIARLAEALRYECRFCYIDQPYYHARYIPTISLSVPSLGQEDLDTVLKMAVGRLQGWNALLPQADCFKSPRNELFRYLHWPYFGVPLLSAVLLELSVKMQGEVDAERLRVCVAPTVPPTRFDVDGQPVAVAGPEKEPVEMGRFLELAVMAAGSSDRLELVGEDEKPDVWVSTNPAQDNVLTLPFLRYIAIPTTTLMDSLRWCDSCLFVGGLDNNLAMLHLLTVKRWKSHGIMFPSNAFDAAPVLDSLNRESVQQERWDLDGPFWPLFDIPVAFYDGDLRDGTMIRHVDTDFVMGYSHGKVKLTDTRADATTSRLVDVHYVGGTSAFLSKLGATLLLLPGKTPLSPQHLNPPDSLPDFGLVRIPRNGLETMDETDKVDAFNGNRSDLLKNLRK